jgi:Domain of unknown function (DUF397)
MLSTAWKTAQRCKDISCVEVRQIQQGVEVRNSTAPDGPVVAFTNTEWASFLSGVEAGEFSITTS